MSNLRRNNVRLSASVFTLMSLTMLLLYWNAGDRLEISEMKEIGRYRLWNRDLSDHVDYPFWEHPQMDTKVKVPRTVHYIRFGGRMRFTFVDHLSMLGSSRNINPMYTFLHADRIPSGYWWNRTIAEVPNIYYVEMIKPSHINGIAIQFIEHASDIARLDILYRYGGIYLDRDVWPVRSFDALRRHDLVLGEEMPGSLANGVMVARGGGPFLRAWRESYRSYRPRRWAYNSVIVPSLLASALPHLVHVEAKSLVRPNYKQLDWLYGKVYDWSANFCIHLYHGSRKNGFGRPRTPEDIDTINSTVGQIGRLLYYGSTRPRNST